MQSLILFIIQAICRLQWNQFTPNLLYTWPINKDLSRTYSIVSRNVPLLLFFCVERVFICLMQYLHMLSCLWIFKALSTPQCIREVVLCTNRSITTVYRRKYMRSNVTGCATLRKRCSPTLQQQSLEHFLSVYFTPRASWCIFKLYFHFCNDCKIWISLFSKLLPKNPFIYK